MEQECLQLISRKIWLAMEKSGTISTGTWKLRGTNETQPSKISNEKYISSNRIIRSYKIESQSIVGLGKIFLFDKVKKRS